MVTVIIIVITAAVSLLCFYGGGFDALKFNAYQVWHQKQWYRLFSYGFVHSGWGHLFFNMLTLYFFGGVVEKYCRFREHDRRHPLYCPVHYGIGSFHHRGPYQIS